MPTRVNRTIGCEHEIAVTEGLESAIARVVASATRFGVELNEDEAAEWVAAMETEASGGELVVNVESGVYGHRVTMSAPQVEETVGHVSCRGETQIGLRSRRPTCRGLTRDCGALFRCHAKPTAA